MLLLVCELGHHFLRHIDRDGRIPSVELLGRTFSRGLALWLRLILGEGKRWQFLAEDARRDGSARGRRRCCVEAASLDSNSLATTISLQ